VYINTKLYKKSSIGIVKNLTPIISLLLYHTGGVFASRYPVKSPFIIIKGIKEIIM
tara:strand:- start:237 stop:404 length:168 start_codon:yes stop_codon:yes gene_type:complete